MKDYVMKGRKPPSPSVLRETAKLLDSGIPIKDVSFSMKIPAITIYKWRSLGWLDLNVLNHPEYDHPKYQDPELPIEKLLDRAEKRFERLHKAKERNEWLEYKMKIDGAFGLVFIGDPHIGDQGCNIRLLREHIDIINKTEGLYGIGLGDYTNNWAGRLAQRIAPLEETTRPQTWRLVDWFFKSVDWFLLIKGNHDVWSGNDDVLEFMYKGAVPIQDWQAKIKILCPNKKEFKVWCAHDFHGHSIYNPLHGPMRKGKFSGLADVYVAGHKHNWALFHVENPENKTTYWASRARGYKFFDAYANVLGIAEQEHGASVCAIFDPNTTGPGSIQMFADIEVASDYLNWKRKKA